MSSQRSCFSVCPASSLSVSSAPPGLPVDGCDPPSLAYRCTHSFPDCLAACATGSSPAPPQAAQGPTDTGSAVPSSASLGRRLVAWKPRQLPDPPRQFLISRAGRSCCPTSPFCATGQRLKSLLQRTRSFSSLHNRTVWLRFCCSKATDYSLGPDLLYD